MTTESWVDAELRKLRALCPPFEAIGVGGSLGAGTGADQSDLDVFILVPDDEFFAIVRDFPTLIEHPWPPVVSRRRGFLPEFGYQFTFVYANRRSIDYVLNCHASLERTPMARKTRVIEDRTGRFTEYHRQVAADIKAESETGRDQAVAAELLIELLRINKYAHRGELVSLVHRLERLRLVLLAQERTRRTGEPYCPHDADKWVARDLGADLTRWLHPTFAPTEPKAAAVAVDLLCAGILDRLGDPTKLDAEFHELVAGLRAEIAERLSAL